MLLQHCWLEFGIQKCVLWLVSTQFCHFGIIRFWHGIGANVIMNKWSASIAWGKFGFPTRQNFLTNECDFHFKILNLGRKIVKFTAVNGNFKCTSEQQNLITEWKLSELQWVLWDCLSWLQIFQFSHQTEQWHLCHFSTWCIACPLAFCNGHLVWVHNIQHSFFVQHALGKGTGTSTKCKWCNHCHFSMNDFDAKQWWLCKEQIRSASSLWHGASSLWPGSKAGLKALGN